MKVLALIPLLILFGGCGTVMSPFFVQLEPDELKVVDGEWNNMFTPTARLDRATLLDVLCRYQELQLGADRTHITAEKYLANGKILLDADFDRENPDADQMTLIALDSAGHTVRRERYFRSEIRERLGLINDEMGLDFRPNRNATTQPHPETPEEKEARLRGEAHLQRLQAATRPASG